MTVPVLDIDDDSGAYLLSLAEPGHLPEAVKTASLADPLSAKDRDFALILIDTDGSTHRKYACCDPGNVLVSMLYLERAQPHLNPAAVKTAAVNLASLARDWDMPVPVEIEKMAGIELSDADLRDVRDARRVVYHPPQRVKAASASQGPFAVLAAAERRWDDLTPWQRHEVAVEMVKAAESVPLEVPPHMYHYAGEKLSEKFASRVRGRLDYTGDKDLRDAYETLAKIASTCEPESVVEALYVLDEAAHLRWAGGDRYGDAIPDPVRCVYGCEKRAAYSWSRGTDTTSETQLHEFLVRPEAQKRFCGMFTDEMWRRFEKEPVSFFKGLPEEQKTLVARMVSEV